MALDIRKIPDSNIYEVALKWNDLEENLNEMKRDGYKNVVINKYWGWTGAQPLDFLYKNDWIEGITVVGDEYDITPINALKNLKYLSTTSKKGKIDFSNFPLLKELWIYWQKSFDENINAYSNFEFLHIWRFPWESFERFKNCVNLKYIQINFSKLASFDGLHGCSSLYRIKLHSAPKLTSIDLPDEVAANITMFSFERCKRVESYKVIEKMANLESLYLFESAPIHSIDFLRGMKKLRYAYIGVDILDKNVSFLKERGFEFKNARLYK